MKKKTQVGVTIPTEELEEMKKVTRVDSSGTAVLALARYGLEVSREGVGKHQVRAK